MRQINLLNVTIHDMTMQELLDRLRDGGIVFTPNVDHVMKLQTNREFYGVYQEADYRVCDSKVLMYVSNFLGTPIQEKISGSDLFPAFYYYYQHDKNINIFLLGSEAEIVDQAGKNINTKVGRDMVTAVHSPSFGFEKNEQECQKIVELINRSQATVLAIGVGAPKQEMWIAKYREQLKYVKIFLAIGATIEFEAGSIERAPKWMSEIGLEWLYRLANEPQRLWKRYILSIFPFFYLILQQRLQLYRNPWLGIDEKTEKQLISMIKK
ncbi:MAG: WecB/TagA/CpsF family glycosyltransferase [Methylacidiphilales bacterium]|nr:WecB/TagA/CpsF family glycosyltransferase [Candidatus Methylacidiphilales bacterium]NJR17816.1 WecB/TagA/CpsF family glycosyltransferase [Calothrix sp. CSU_2_0]